VVIPEIHIRPGEVQHWRMVHAGVFHNWLFAIDGHPSNIIAYDGLTLEKPEVVPEFLFVSGQRRDILVQASMTPGTYAVRRKAYKQAAEVNTWPEITLFNLVVDGEPVKMGLPTKLNRAAERLPYVSDKEIVHKRTVAFNFVDDTEHNIFLFTIDNNVFNPNQINYSMVLGTAEEWTVTNNPASDHPFHIHVNWIEVLKVTDESGKVTTYDPPIWMDTINVPRGGNAVVRMRLQNFQGKSVFHCHLLTHEDEGMMALIEIVDGSPETTTITPTGDTFVSHDYENRVQVRFPKDSVLANTEVTYQYLASPNVPTVNPAPALPTEFADYNTFFRLEAQQGGKALGELNRPAFID
ncbi:MAG: multicopper oxidase family protein, partial [Pseudonocardiaceae bacterium]